MAEKGNGNPLELALAQIEKQFGKGAVMRLDDNVVQKVEAISTGCLTLDIALGIGGIPKGRIIEIYGPESSGKTTVALHIVAEVQKAGGTAAFIDAEHALDPSYAAKLGVHLEDLYISQPDSGDQALAIMEMLIRSGAIDLVVVDSVAALTPQAEIDGEMGDSHVGLQARLMSQALRKITAVTSKTGCSIIFINQLREKVGVVYGSAETTTGGKALKFYASVRIDVRRTESLKDGSDIIGNRSCTARAFPLSAASSTSVCRTASSRRAAVGSATTTRRSGRAERKPSSFCAPTPTSRRTSTARSAKSTSSSELRRKARADFT